MLNEFYIIIFCRTIYFDMLSMQHSSKQELNKIYFFYIFGGFHVEFILPVSKRHRIKVGITLVQRRRF